MLKWIGGCLVVAVILIAGGSFFAMRKMRESLSPDGSARVAIHAPPERVFASLSSADSAATYMAAGNKVTTSRRGAFQVGDSVRVEIRAGFGKPQPMIWVVKEIIPNQKMVFELGAVGATGMSAIRRDSVFAKGDSTIVTSRFAAPLPDSAKSSSTIDLMRTVFQIASKLELESLKARIEGRPATPRRP